MARHFADSLASLRCSRRSEAHTLTDREAQGKCTNKAEKKGHSSHTKQKTAKSHGHCTLHLCLSLSHPVSFFVVLCALCLQSKPVSRRKVVCLLVTQGVREQGTARTTQGATTMPVKREGRGQAAERVKGKRKHYLRTCVESGRWDTFCGGKGFCAGSAVMSLAWEIRLVPKLVPTLPR